MYGTVRPLKFLPQQDHGWEQPRDRAGRQGGAAHEYVGRVAEAQQPRELVRVGG